MTSGPAWVFAALLSLAQTGADEIRDITAIEALPSPPPFPWEFAAWITAGAVLAGLVVLIVWRVARRRGLWTWDPEQWALRELDRLDRWSLPGRGKLSLVDRVVRGYLQKRFQLPARRLTTQELLPLLGDFPPWLKEFFERGDLVKYARLEPDAPELNRWMEHARQWLLTQQDLSRLRSTGLR